MLMLMEFFKLSITLLTPLTDSELLEPTSLLHLKLPLLLPQLPLLLQLLPPLKPQLPLQRHLKLLQQELSI